MPTEDEPRVEVRRSARRRRTVTAYREADAIVVLIPARMSRAEERVQVAEMVGRVLARERRRRPPGADAELLSRAVALSERHLAPRLGFTPTPDSVVWVTNQNHRWGSCTPAAGTIRLSHRMRQMPSWVVDYVLVHELAHLAEGSHSARFWTLVSGFAESEKAQGFLEGFLAGQAAGSGPAAPRGGSTGGDGSCRGEGLGRDESVDDLWGGESPV